MENSRPSITNTNASIEGIQYERNPGAEYGNHIKNTGAICNSSASHTYGNVMAVIEKYLLDTFPPNFFKTVTANTALASRQLTHLPHQLMKKDSPIMVLIPRISFGQDENRFLANTLINSRITNTHALYGEGSLLELARDIKQGIHIHGHYNRAVMFIDIVLSFNTYSEQINAMNFIYNMIPIGHNQMIGAPLELFIPRDFCQLIGIVSKHPLVKTEGQKESVHDFLTYMNSIWHYPITYKLKGGSNTDEFFMYYLTDIDTVMQDVQPGQGVKDGQIRRAFDITFSIRCEFNTIGYFTLNAPDIKKNVSIAYQDDASISPIFSDVINLSDYELPIGWSILSWPIFKLAEGENSVDISPILNQSLTTVIDYHLMMGMPMDSFIQFQFRENGIVLPNELFHIDWYKKELILLKPDHRRTYRLIISVSYDYINNLIERLYNLE